MVLICDNGDHLLLHLFVGLVVFLPDCDIIGILLNETEYFLNDEVVNGIVFDFFSMCSEFLAIDALYLLQKIFIDLAKLILIYKFLENEQLLLHKHRLHLLNHSHPRHNSGVTVENIPPLALAAGGGFARYFNIFIFGDDVFFAAYLKVGVFDFLFNVCKVAFGAGEQMFVAGGYKLADNFFAQIDTVFGFELSEQLLQTIFIFLIGLDLELIFEAFEDEIYFVFG